MYSCPKTWLWAIFTSLLWPCVCSETPLRVTILLDGPYVQLKKGEGLTGNDRYQGLVIELLEMISRLANFTYVIHEVRDDNWGVEVDGNGTWNGMIGELIRGEADMAAAPLTKSFERSKVVDMSTAWLHFGNTIMYHKNPVIKVKFFQFLTPFTSRVWLFTIGGLLLNTLLFWLLSRLSPLEQNDQQLTLTGSFWATGAALLQQGGEWMPRSASTKLLSGVWWFFSLLLISCYTANLAAFLSIQRQRTVFTSVEELAAQTDVPYGVIANGSIMHFFREAHIDTYKRMWHYMSTHPSTFVQNTTHQIHKLGTEDYAAIQDSVTAEYFVKQSCNLMMVGGLFSSEGGAFAFPKGSPWEANVSKAMLYLQDNSTLAILKDKWWSASNKECNIKPNDDLDALGLPAFVGIFASLIAGNVTAILVGVVEWLFIRNKPKDKLTQQQPPVVVSQQKNRGVKRSSTSADRPRTNGEKTRHKHKATVAPVRHRQLKEKEMNGRIGKV